MKKIKIICLIMIVMSFLAISACTDSEKDENSSINSQKEEISYKDENPIVLPEINI